MILRWHNSFYLIKLYRIFMFTTIGTIVCHVRLIYELKLLLTCISLLNQFPSVQGGCHDKDVSVMAEIYTGMGNGHYETCFKRCKIILKAAPRLTMTVIFSWYWGKNIPNSNGKCKNLSISVDWEIFFCLFLELPSSFLALFFFL